ncbi:uncharacterized protein LOC143275248 [Babylonia areolata]|uniref:uncharacterized protein LOC143275248 n=1 Tax=Babylonia areolata TaxID=304850 RepID=UPI003FD6BDC4
MGRHNIRTDRNHGFRSSYSCEMQLITTMHDLFESYDARKQTDVVILDLSKAFYKCWVHYSSCVTINDLPEAVKSKVRLFADDCLLYRNIDTLQDHITLQEDLRHLEDCAKRWGMRFSAQKCYILSSRRKSSYLYSLSGVFLKQVQQNPYLGVLISDDLKWGQHIANISRKAGSTVGFYAGISGIAQRSVGTWRTSH